MKKVYFLLVAISLIFLVLVVLRFISPEDSWYCKNGQWLKHGNPKAAMPLTSCPSSNLVGADRDDHDCIGSAGYSWCELKQKCLRSWEEKCEPEAASASSTDSFSGATFGTEALVLSPKQNELVSSPIKVEGQAKGTWFFEASLPLRLFDNEDNLIGAHTATAQGNWMTEKPVRFSANLIFTTKATSGYLLISKDNPSDLPQNDSFIKVPVRFK